MRSLRIHSGIIKPILRSSDKSWNETGHIPKVGEAADTIRQDADAGEIPGPLDLGFALSRISPRPDKREQRVVVIGDGDFLSNSFLGNGGNREFGQRVFDWLLGDDDQIAVPDKSAPDRVLALTQTQLGVAQRRVPDRAAAAARRQRHWRSGGRRRRVTCDGERARIFSSLAIVVLLGVAVYAELRRERALERDPLTTMIPTRSARSRSRARAARRAASKKSTATG